jgi:hypothetical protein
LETRNRRGLARIAEQLLTKAPNLSTKELSRLRRTRQTSASTRGVTERKVEKVCVYTCDGQTAKPCGDFIYLGSLLDMTANATPEVRRRIEKALTTFGSLNRVWKTKTLLRRTKAKLYKALILSIMLYNSEVWPVKKQDMKALEGAHFTMVRRMIPSEKQDEHFTKEGIFSKFNMPSITDLITTRRLRWIGHALRRPDQDTSKKAVRRALQKEKSIWTKGVINDCNTLGLDFDKLEKTAQSRMMFRKMTYLHSAYAQARG